MPNTSFFVRVAASAAFALTFAGCAGKARGRGTGLRTVPSTGPAAHVPPVTGEEEKAILTNVVQLTDGFEKAGEGYFSHDMKWIIFQATPPGEKNYQMHVAPLMLSDTPGAAADRPGIGTPVRITPKDSRNTCGFFAPDGKTIIFASTAGKDDPNEPTAGYQRQGAKYKWDFPKGMEIYQARDWIKDLPSGGPATLPGYPNLDAVLGPTVDLAKPENRITNNDAYDAEDAYSPDGKWICFTSLRTGDAEIFVMRPDGSDPVQITHAKGYDGGPFFSPDGKRLVYRSDRKGNDLLQIFVADLAFDDDGNITGIADEHQLTDDGNVNWGPYWHPDGNHLIFATSRHGHQNYELYTIRDDGSHATRVTYTDGFDGLPVFSPRRQVPHVVQQAHADNTTQLFLAKFNPPKDW